MGASPPGAPYQGSALDPLETFGGPQTPRRLSSPLTQNPGSAPENKLIFNKVMMRSAESHFAPLGYIILIACQPVFVLSLMLRASTRSGLEPTIYHSRGEHANHLGIIWSFTDMSGRGSSHNVTYH